MEDESCDRYAKCRGNTPLNAYSGQRTNGRENSPVGPLCTLSVPTGVDLLYKPDLSGLLGSRLLGLGAVDITATCDPRRDGSGCV